MIKPLVSVVRNQQQKKNQLYTSLFPNFRKNAREYKMKFLKFKGVRGDDVLKIVRG